MKVDGLDIDVGVESVLVEEKRVTCVMSHVEAILKNITINIFGSLLQGNDMPLPRNLFLKCVFPSTSGSSC